MNKLTERDFCEAAAYLKCSVAAIKSVALCESGGRGGFDEKGRVLLRFEGHKFRKATGGRYDKTHSRISYAYHESHKNCGCEHGYTGFNEAYALDQDAAMESCSIGMFQPMVFNFREMGYSDIHEMWDDFKLGEKQQLLAFCRLIKKWELDDELRRATLDDFTTFARMYNGARYRDNRYHTKMHDGFKNYSRQNIDCSKYKQELTAANVGDEIDKLNITRNSPEDSEAGSLPAPSYPETPAEITPGPPSVFPAKSEPEPNTVRETIEKKETPTGDGGTRSVEESETKLPGDAPDALPKSWFNVEDWKPWVFGKLKLTAKSFVGFNLTQGAGSTIAAAKIILTSGEYWYVPIIVGSAIFILSLVVFAVVVAGLLLIWYFNRREIKEYKLAELDARHDPAKYNFGLKFQKIGESVSRELKPILGDSQ